MNIKHDVLNPAKHKHYSISTVDQTQKIQVPSEIKMSDISAKLRYVYEKMQIKKTHNHLAKQISVDNSIKSYLDEISRAILAEHYARNQKEKKLFEDLEQIKKLVKNLLYEKEGLQKTIIKQHKTSSQSINSVVRHLAHMAGEENKRSQPHERFNTLKKDRIQPVQTNTVGTLKQENISSLSTDFVKPSKNFLTNKNLSDTQLLSGFFTGVRRAFSFKE
ncbi:conserved protein of unknown function [Bartonella clarridgeiae 73]|uniref:Uncharacterized protein n=1 Tax=Bartonella clarridgeiae (strain CCUG 45776 / CIP 104772 / 73) TaxID=696125 RepID=E6YGH2_BARC7|nr:hypothetical protein [Bartonella clarridgeiae]WCR55440.1 MAG: hypothetical protein PG977_000833 [Bartonella clarridgeiae]CBI75960.1 conserved protein of unknown function [Bartonella clarridgeiae 73]